MSKIRLLVKEKVISMALMVGMLISLVTVNPQKVEAATTLSNVSIVCYTTSWSNVTTYTTSSLNSRSGYICAGDRCTILDVYGNGAVRVRYPISGGRYKTAYASAGYFFVNTNFSTSTTKIGKNLTAYRKSSGNSTIGSVYANDNIILVGTSNGRTQVMYPVSGSNSWKLGWISGTYSAGAGRTIASVSEGYYIIKSAINSNYVLDIDGASSASAANLQVYQRNNTAAQKFYLKKYSDGYYSLQPYCAPGLSIDVWNNGYSNGTNLAQYPSHGGNNQKFQILKTSDGYYSFKSKSNGLFIDVNGGYASNGINVQCWEDNSTAAQKFMLEATSVSGNSNTGTLASPVPSGSKFNRKTSDNGWYGYHDININVSSTTPVYAIADGTVTFKQAYRYYNGVQYLTSYGNFIQFSSSDGKYTAKYCHLSGFNGVNPRISSSRTKQVSGSNGVYTLATRTVKKGELLGYIGMTGNASGVHLHFELYQNGKRIDPTSVISGLK